MLHLLRSAPDEMTRLFIDESSKDKESSEVCLYEGATDYDALIEKIFENDRVISWW